MAIDPVFTKTDFVNFFKGLPFGIGSYYNNSFPYNCLYYQRNNADNVPIYTADCWNMIKAAIWSDLTLPTIIGGYSYAPGRYGLQDWNGYQILIKCTDISSDFTSLTPGEYLITRDYDHAGVYVGYYTNGTYEWNVVECTPIWANGIQFSWVDADGTRRNHKGGSQSVYWARHAKLPWVDYNDDPPPTPDPPDPPEPPSPEPDVPAKNINFYVVDKNVKKITIVRDNSQTTSESTYIIPNSIKNILIDFEENV